MTAKLNARSATFITAVRALGEACDDEIEHTAFSGGGIRFTGFCRLSLRKVGNVLRSYGKRAVYKIDDVYGAKLYVDCYDDIDPQAPQLQAIADIRPALTRLQQDYTKGAVVYSPFMCQQITSESVQSILLDTSILDITVSEGNVYVLKVSPRSVNVVGGLAMQIQTNPKMRFIADQESKKPAPALRFKNGGPRILKLKKPTKKKSWIWSLIKQ